MNNAKRRPTAIVPTPAELECLRALQRLNRRKKPGEETSLAELSQELGYAYKTGVQGVLARCEAKGFVAPKKIEVTRGREVTPAGSKWL